MVSLKKATHNKDLQHIDEDQTQTHSNLSNLMISYMNSKRNSCYNSVSNKGVNVQTREIDLLGTDSTVIRKQKAPP